jgi:hypothetical protein
VIVASARSTTEYQGVVNQLVDRVPLSPNTGLDWKEVLFGKLEAQAITETTINENPQRFTDSAITIRPQMVQIHTEILDKVKRNITQKSLAQMGKLTGEAMTRKADQDGLAALAGSTTELGTANTPVATGDVSSARYRITGNPTEPGPMPISAVFHGWSIKDFYDELVAGLGTYPIPTGPTADVFKGGFTLPICNVTVHEDGNVPIDTNDDALGFVFSKMAWILVVSMGMTREVVRRPEVGGGADAVFITHEYAYGQRSPGNWSYKIRGDATAPA